MSGCEGQQLTHIVTLLLPWKYRLTPLSGWHLKGPESGFVRTPLSNLLCVGIDSGIKKKVPSAQLPPAGSGVNMSLDCRCCCSERSSIPPLLPAPRCVIRCTRSMLLMLFWLLLFLLYSPSSSSSSHRCLISVATRSARAYDVSLWCVCGSRKERCSPQQRRGKRWRWGRLTSVAARNWGLFIC